MTRAALVLLALAGCCGRPAPEPEPRAPALCVVRGTLKFHGTPPKRKLIRGDGGRGFPAGGILQEDLVVDADNNVRWAFVYVKKGLEERDFPPDPTPVLLDQSGFRYEPHVLGVRVGQSIEIANRDQVLHSFHPIPSVNREYGRSMPIPGIRETLSYSRPEIMIPVKCDVHPWMRAWIGVVEHPFFAVTNEAGNYEIRNLPAGKYTLGAWHERLAIDDQEIEVKGDLSLNLVGVLK